MSKAEKQQVPKIRFDGFSENWEKNRLSSVFSIFSGNAFSSKDQAEKGIIWLKIADVGIQKMTPNNLSYLPFGYEDTYEKYLIKKDDVVIALTRPILDKHLKIAVAGENYHGALLNQRVGKIVSSNNHILFIYCLLQQEKLISDLESSIAGTDPPNLSLNEIKDISLVIPSKEEQTQIGNFFQQLDKLIDLQSHAVESAETYKKAMLQKMFPQKGEKVPRVRFEGFSGDWDEESLDHVIKSEFKGKAQESLLFKGNTEYLDANRLNGGIPKLVSLERDVEYEDILILWDGSKAGTVYKGFTGVLGSTLKCYKITKNYNHEFIYQYMKSHEDQIFQQYRTPNIPHVIRDFADMFMVVAPCIEEQEKIGKFFQKLDHNIESEKKKLEQYQTMKRAMLQRMFV